MFNQLTLKQRVTIQLLLNVTLQVVIVTGVLMDWSKMTLILSSLGVGLFMLWLYLDSAMASKQFVEELISGAERMGQGDLTKDVSTSFGNPTLREGLGTMQALQTRIRSMLGALNEGAWQVSNASAEIASGNLDLSRRTEQGSSELQLASSAMKEMTDAAAQSSEAMQKATNLSQGTSALVHTSGAVVNQAVAAMGEINNSSRKIADIISVIDGIAFQTNILALNAAVEAARAGEQGRGFAVVASEVRSLAGRSAEAAKEIKSLITASVEQVEKGAGLVNDAGEKMGEVVKAIEEVSSLIVEASGKSQQQTRGLHEISTTLEHLDVAMQQNAALVEQETAAAESLKHQAAKLHALVGEFKLPGNTAGMGAHAAPPHRPKAPAAARPAAVQHRAPATKTLAKPAAKGANKPLQKLTAPSKPQVASAPKPAARGADDDWETSQVPGRPPMDNSSSHTFLWHDYETFGAVPRRDRPAQFAAIRTDADLNELGEPLMLFCQPAPDFLPDPQSCLITGITPQQCLEQGVPEHQFAAAIEQAFSLPGTIGVGYNTIRFDDEITRFMFWRNLMDPYAREWQNQCGRWDLLDVVRTAYALRPEGIEWPTKPEGGASFKLTDLSAANGLLHAAAHDALSDVRATIALARLIKVAQPRLFDFCLGLHKKDRVAAELGLPTAPRNARPFWHVSGMFPAERGCLALMWPLAMHPKNKNELIAWDLAFDPRELESLKVADLRLRLFSKTVDLPDGMTRLPVKTIHLNKSPMVMANLKVLSPAMAQRWGIDVDAQLQHAEHARDLPDMSAIWPEVFERPDALAPLDVDEDLYGGFVSNADRRRLNDLRAMSPQQLSNAHPAFEDARLPELLFRYRARNYPEILTDEESERWEAHRAERLFDGANGARTVEQLFDQIDQLSEDVDERGEAILGALYDYAESIAPHRE